MKFKIKCKDRTGREKIVIYDPSDSSLTTERGTPYLIRAVGDGREFTEARGFSPDKPHYKQEIKTLKIQLGLSCNYECSYCNQRFVPHADQTSAKDIENFIGMLGDMEPSRVEFWGGEPLVYIKTLKPLANELREMLPDAKFVMVTNGSLLTPELNEWLDDMGFHIGISHDGPGQYVRGPDPLDDPKSREGILDLYRRLSPKGRVSFNAMMNKQNQNRAKVQDFFVRLTGDKNVQIGEGAMISPYDEGGMDSSLKEIADHIEYRRLAQGQARSLQITNFGIFNAKVKDLVESFRTGRPASSLTQKCGMDDPSKIAVDLHGNVLSCQNVSAVSNAMNGNPHKIGHLTELENVTLNTGRGWQSRDNCGKCPVLQACAGSCFILEGPLFHQACESSFSDNIVFLFAAIEAVTGLVPYYIDSDHLPQHRKDIFGIEPETIAPKKKIILLTQVQ